MKENIRMIKSSGELNREEGKKKNTTELQVKIKEMHKIKKHAYIFFCIYKMHLILAERYKDVELEFLRERKTDEIWVSMKSVHDGLGVKNMSDLVLKEIYDKYERKNLTSNDIKKFKMTDEKFLKSMII